MSDEPRLLVVDDDPVICFACRRIFSDRGFEVEESTDAREGLKRATEQEYAGILLDIKMPGIDGIQFLEELRKCKPALPVLIMTGYPSLSTATAAVELGASGYITKPFTPAKVRQAVQDMLSRREQKECT
ncbi:MAG: response regulator [Planctomycetes bacterium]|nr:response regulator [Planctomycetota bacterium]MBL7039127.1 response regulator [Pirellulaceae bacterium]